MHLMSEPVLWTGDGSPHSARFNDRYRSKSGGLAQASSVFLAGCDLPAGWFGRNRFTVLETGFGLGLNFLATWAAWEVDALRCGRLHFVSVEAYPVAAADIVRSALTASCCSMANLEWLARAQALAQMWHDLKPGFHDFDFVDGRVRLTVAVGEVQTMLGCLDCQADAVYLDGFSPALNPQMWSADTLRAVALHCRPGTTLATYTAARNVRDGLERLGFLVQRCSGLPPKRHRLAAVFLP